MQKHHSIDSEMGRVVAITRYPVKSMAGENLSQAEVDWQGIEGDRQYAYVRRGNTSRFPWLTARDVPDLILHKAVYTDSTTPRTSPVLVIDKEGRRWDLRDPGLTAALEQAATAELDLLQLGIGAYDLMPLSIVTTGSLAQLDARYGGTVDPRRLRANIVVDCPTTDREWGGHHLRIGDQDGIELLAAYLAPRCSMVTIDPDTAERNPRVMRTIAQDFGGSFTMYASVAHPGIIRVGDVVRVIG